MAWINKLVNTFGTSIKPKISPVQIKEKRTDDRTELSKMKIGITDGCISCTATLRNISSTGVCLSNIPKSLYGDLEVLTLFGPEYDKIPTIQIHPKWDITHGNRKTIGASVVNPTDSWLRFTQLSKKNYQSKQDQ